VRVGLIDGRDRIPVRLEIDMPYAYVVYDHGRKRNVDEIRAWLDARDILLAGRYAEWEYFNSDHAFIAGKRAAEAARHGAAAARSARAHRGREDRGGQPGREEMGGQPDRAGTGVAPRAARVARTAP
jgi:hypothetical protein